MSTDLHLAADFTLPVDAVTEAFAILARRGMGKTVTASVFAEELISAGQPAIVLDPTGAWWGLRSSADGTSPALPVVIFGGEHADVPLDEHAGTRLAQIIVKQRFPAVIDLSLLSKSAMRRFVADFAETLYHRNREPLHLVVDECDLFIPQRTFSGMERLVGAMEDIVRRGRLRGLGVTLISQRPAVINKDVLSQVGCLIVLGLTGTHDISAIDDWVRLHADPDEARKVKASLPSLPVGTAWFWSPGWLGVLRQVKIRMRHTFDSSATPKVGQVRAVPREWARVDVAALSELLAATEPATGKANDPDTLKRRLAALEGELAAERARPREVERVEVPAIGEDVLMELASLLTDYRKVGERIDATVGRLMAGFELAVSTPLPPAAAPARAQISAPAARPAPSRRPEGASSAGMGRCERAILAVLAQHPNGRTRIQLALLTGYSVKSSSLSNALGALRSAGLVSRGGDLIQATQQGLEQATTFGDAEPLPTGRDLYEWWASRLGRAERAVLDVLSAAWPQELSRDEIAARSGYSATSSSLSNALGKLRSLDLVDGWTASAEFMDAVRER